MSHFAQIDKNDIVTNIIVCEQSDIDSGHFGDPSTWIETDPRTIFNVHYGEDMKPDGGTPLRANYACIGEKYDRVNDVFYPSRPMHKSWTISGPDWMWKAPKPMPTDGKRYTWNEAQLNWILRT